MATPQFILTAGLSLLLFMAFANLIVFQYGQGVVRAARRSLEWIWDFDLSATAVKETLP